MLCTEPFNLATPLSDLQELDKTEIYFARPGIKQAHCASFSPDLAWRLPTLDWGQASEKLKLSTTTHTFMSQVPFTENFFLCEIELVSKEGDARKYC